MSLQDMYLNLFRAEPYQFRANLYQLKGENRLFNRLRNSNCEAPHIEQK
jgi:hypothetical protein